MAGHAHVLTPSELQSIFKRHQPEAKYGKQKGKIQNRTGQGNKGRAASHRTNKRYYLSRINGDGESQIRTSRRKTMRREKSEPKLTSRSYPSTRYLPDPPYLNKKHKSYTSRGTKVSEYENNAVHFRQTKRLPHVLYHQDLEIESNQKGWKNFGKKRKKRNQKPNVSYGNQHYQKAAWGKRNRGQHFQEFREVNVQHPEIKGSDAVYVASVERGSNHISFKPKKGADHLALKVSNASRKSPMKLRRSYTDDSYRKQRKPALLIYEIPYRKVEKDSSTAQPYKSKTSQRKSTKPKVRRNVSLMNANELKRKQQKSPSYGRHWWDNARAFSKDGKAFDTYNSKKKILSPIETEVVSRSYIDDFMRTNVISPGAQMSFDPENNSTEISELSPVSIISHKISTSSRGYNPNPNLNIDDRETELQSDQEPEDSLVAPDIDTLSEGNSIILHLSEVCDEDIKNRSVRSPVANQNCEVHRVRSRSHSASGLGSWGKPNWWSVSNVPSDYHDPGLSEDDEKSFVILKKFAKNFDNEDLASEVSSSVHSVPNSHGVREPTTTLTVHTNRYGVNKDGRKKTRNVVPEDQQGVAGIPDKRKRNTKEIKNFGAGVFGDNFPLRPRARESRIDNASVSSLSDSGKEQKFQFKSKPLGDTMQPVQIVKQKPVE